MKKKISIIIQLNKIILKLVCDQVIIRSVKNNYSSKKVTKEYLKELNFASYKILLTASTGWCNL